MTLDAMTDETYRLARAFVLAAEERGRDMANALPAKATRLAEDMAFDALLNAMNRLVNIGQPQLGHFIMAVALTDAGHASRLALVAALDAQKAEAA